MEYSKEYHNQDWLFNVWRARDGSDYILMAVYPGVAWEDVAIKLTEDETNILRESEEQFTDFVKEIVANRNTPRVKERRIESKARMTGPDEMTIEG